jgi:serine/threonine-protein kinase RsbW
MRAELSSIPPIKNMLGRIMTSSGFSQHEVLQAQLALEEACTNIIMYAYPSGDGMIYVSVEVIDGVLRINIVDEGVPFDTENHEAVLPMGRLEDRPAGGMGIYLIRKLMDEVSYERRDGKNILRLIKNRKL